MAVSKASLKSTCPVSLSTSHVKIVPWNMSNVIRV